MAIKRVACYERVSTEEQAVRGFSIVTQIDNLKEYCDKNNLKIVDHYTDEGISGAKPPLKRPALKRLIEDVEAGKIDMVLFTKLDRWFRSVKEYFKVQEILDAKGVQWKAIHEDYDTTTANGQMAITIFLAVAQNERDRTSERIKVVFENKRKNKEACFGGQAVPMGYMKQPDENGVMRLVKDPEMETAVQEFWDILIKDNNLNKAIRHMLNNYGVDKDWKSWSYITKSDFYTGTHRGVKDFCPAYVSEEDFQKFQERDTIKFTPSGQVYFFRGMMRCPKCGNKMSGQNTKKKYGVYKSYRCGKRGRGCDNHNCVSEKKIEKYLLNNLEELLKDEIASIEIEQRSAKPKPKSNIKSLKEKRRRLTVAYMAGNIPDEQYLREDAEFKALIAKAEETEPPKPRDTAHLKTLLETDFKSVYMTLTDEGKQRFWQSLIKEIKIEGKEVKSVIFF